MSSGLTDVFSVVAKFCYPGTLWSLKLTCREFHDAVNQATETFVVPFAISDPRFPEMYIGLYYFRTNTVVVTKRCPAKSRIRTGKAITREFQQEDADVMVTTMIQEWAKTPAAVVDEDSGDDGAGRVARDLFGDSVRIIMTKTQKENDSATQASALLDNIKANDVDLCAVMGANVPFVIIASMQSNQFELAASMQKKLSRGPTRHVYTPKFNCFDGDLGAKRMGYKEGTFLATEPDSGWKIFSSSGGGASDGYVPDKPNQELHHDLQRRMHIYLHTIMAIPKIEPYHGRAPPGFETTSPEARKDQFFIAKNVSDLRGVVGRAVWEAEGPPPWVANQHATCSFEPGSFEEALAALNNDRAAVAEFQVPFCEASSVSEVDSSLLCDTLRNNIFKIDATPDACVAEKHIWQWISEMLIDGTSEAGKAPPSPPASGADSERKKKTERLHEDEEKVLLKVGRDDCDRAVLVPLREMRYENMGRGSRNGNFAIYVADNRYLGTFYVEDFYNPTALHKHPAFNAVMTPPRDDQLQDGQPLDVPWILWGYEGTFSSSHSEPHGSCVWVHLFHGVKEWFVRLPASVGEARSTTVDFTKFLQDSSSSALPDAPSRSQQEKWSWYRFNQRAGETVFMPNGIEHVVRNCSNNTFAIARNYIVN